MSYNTVYVNERRRHHRTICQMTLRALRMDPDGDMVDMLHMIDISRGGVGAIASKPYYPGQKIVLDLPLTQGGRRNFSATVVRCRPCSEGYHIGVKFDGQAAVETPDRNRAAA